MDKKRSVYGARSLINQRRLGTLELQKVGRGQGIRTHGALTHPSDPRSDALSRSASPTQGKHPEGDSNPRLSN
jgi:hypothetical protein